MRTWATAACRIDDWTVADDCVETRTSSSVSDVLQSCGQLVDTVRQHSFLSGAAASGDSVLASAMRAYCDALIDAELAVAKTTLHALQVFHHSLVVSSGTTVVAPPSLELTSCVRANDLYTVPLHVAGEELELNENGPTPKYVKWTLATQMSALLLPLARVDQRLIDRIVAGTDTEMDALITCLDEHMTVAFDGLVESLMLRHVKQVWDHIVAAIEQSLITYNDGVRRSERLMEKVREFLLEHCDGLRAKYFEASAAWERFCSMVTIVQSTSAALASSEEAKSDPRVSRVLEARARAPGGDAAASAFLATSVSAATVQSQKEALEITRN
jgi:hypothetical protein